MLSAFPEPSAPPLVERYSEAEVPTEYGTFRLVAYRHDGLTQEHCAIVHGEVGSGRAVLTRVHSECLTGEVLHSLKCDCRQQLDLALRRIAEAEAGLVLYLRQEGRGIGLGNKLKAYALQEQGFDTVDANTKLGFFADARSYHVASAMLADLGVRSVRLLTNNPAKVAALRMDGIEVLERLDHIVTPNPHNAGYLRTKRVRMGHVLEVDPPYDAE